MAQITKAQSARRSATKKAKPSRLERLKAKGNGATQPGATRPRSPRPSSRKKAPVEPTVGETVLGKALANTLAGTKTAVKTKGSKVAEAVAANAIKTEKEARELVADGYRMTGVRQGGGTFLVKGTDKRPLAKPVKPLKRAIARMITDATRKAKAAEPKTPTEAEAK